MTSSLIAFRWKCACFVPIPKMKGGSTNANIPHRMPESIDITSIAINILLLMAPLCLMQRWSLVALNFSAYVKGRQFDRIVDIFFGDLQVLRTT